MVSSLWVDHWRLGWTIGLEIYNVCVKVDDVMVQRRGRDWRVAKGFVCERLNNMNSALVGKLHNYE